MIKSHRFLIAKSYSVTFIKEFIIKRYPSTFISVLLTGFRYFSYQIAIGLMRLDGRLLLLLLLLLLLQGLYNGKSSILLTCLYS